MDMNAEIISDSVDIDASPVVSEVDLEISPDSSDTSMEVEGDILVRTEKDYNKLENLPFINDVLIKGRVSLSDLNLSAIYYDTTAHWNARVSLKSEKGAIYIYSDHQSIVESGETILVPGIKIGDGLAYVIDLPFVSNDNSRELKEHIRNTAIHVTLEEKSFWNNKLNMHVDSSNPENLVFTRL